MEVGEKGDYYTYRYTVTTRMTPTLRCVSITLQLQEDSKRRQPTAAARRQQRRQPTAAAR